MILILLSCSFDDVDDVDDVDDEDDVDDVDGTAAGLYQWRCRDDYGEDEDSDELFFYVGFFGPEMCYAKS